jgi:hypothetical protein
MAFADTGKFNTHSGIIAKYKSAWIVSDTENWLYSVTAVSPP